MSRRQLPRTTAAVLDAATFLPGEIAVDTTNDELRYDGDGSTVGGIVVAKKSDVTAIDGRVDALEALTENLSAPISSAMTPVVQAATTAEAAREGSYPYRLTNIAALQAVTWASADAPLVVVLEYNYQSGDGGGVFRYDSSDTSSSDDGGMTILTATSGTALRYKRQTERVYLHFYCAGNPYGTAVASLTDNRVQIQRALDYCFTNGHALYVAARKRVFAASEAAGSVGYCLYNQGVSIEFEPAPEAFQSRFTFANGIGAGVDFMRCQPPGSGAAIDAWHFRYLNVDTSYLGTARGKRALYFTFDLSGGTSVNQLILDHFRGGNAGGGYSVEILSDDAINAAGVPFGLQVYGGYYSEGLKAAGISDSCAIRDALFRSTDGSGRIGLDLQTVTAASARPQKGLIDNVNIDADGGAIAIKSGWGWDLRSLDIEQTHGTCTAIIDLSGADEALKGTLIDGLSLGVFGTAAATSAVRINAATYTQMRSYTIQTAPTGGGFTAPTNGILITASAEDTVIDANGSYIIPGRFTNDINNAGTRTRFSVIAPSSTDNAMARYDGTKGQLQNSGVVVDDSNNVTGIAALTATNHVGTTTNDSAAAGSIGEYVESEILVGGSLVSLTTGTPANVTSISLTAGDWDVWGNVGFSLNAATTLTNIIGWVSATSATLPANPNKGGQAYLNLAFTTGGGQLLGIPGRRFSLASTTTIYLSTQAAFGVNTCAAFGSIVARRVR